MEILGDGASAWIADYNGIENWESGGLRECLSIREIEWLTLSIAVYRDEDYQTSWCRFGSLKP
jgi:hypothetical protein